MPLWVTHPATLYPQLRGSVLVPLALLGLPERIRLSGETWHVRPEFHVTALDAPWIAERAAVPLERAWAAVAAVVGGRRVGPVRVGDEIRIARRGDDRTLIVMAGVDGLEALYRELADRLGAEVPRPPAHITLYSGAPGAPGIGIHDEDELVDLTRPVAARDAAELRAAIGFDIVFR